MNNTSSQDIIMIVLVKLIHGNEYIKASHTCKIKEIESLSPLLMECYSAIHRH